MSIAEFSSDDTPDSWYPHYLFVLYSVVLLVPPAVGALCGALGRARTGQGRRAALRLGSTATVPTMGNDEDLDRQDSALRSVHAVDPCHFAGYRLRGSWAIVAGPRTDTDQLGIYPSRMPDESDISDDEIDSWLEEWEAVDRAAADYLAERIPEVREILTDEEARWVDELAGTISPAEEPHEHEIEAVSAVMALQHADWLGLALGVVRRGPGSTLDPELVQDDIERLDDVEDEIEDAEGHLAVLEMALLHLTPLWQRLDVLDEDQRLTERGVWGLPRALQVIWRD